MNMRAFVLTRYGGPDVMELRDVPRPSPGSGEVLIHVYAAGLNPVDFKMREGMLRVISRYPLPIIAGCELSGVVVAKGSGVTRLAEGDRVFTRVDKRALGAFAEFAVVREELVAKMPSSVDFTTAAGVPLAGLTALQALRDELRVASGQHIFISGGLVGWERSRFSLESGLELTSQQRPQHEARKWCANLERTSWWTTPGSTSSRCYGITMERLIS